MPFFDQAYFDQTVFDALPASNEVQLRGAAQVQGDIVFICSLRANESTIESECLVSMEADETDANYERQNLTGDAAVMAASQSSDRRLGLIPGSIATTNLFAPLTARSFSPVSKQIMPSMLALSGVQSSHIEAVSLRRSNVAAVDDYDITVSGGDGFANGSVVSPYLVPKNQIVGARIEASTTSVALTIPSGYRDIKVTALIRTDEAAASSGFVVKANADATAANYDSQPLSGATSTVGATQTLNSQVLYQVPGASATAGVFGGGSTVVHEYTKTDRHKNFVSMAGLAGERFEAVSMGYSSTDAISTLTFSIAGGSNMLSGSAITVEGIGKDSIGWEDQAVQRGSLVGHGYKVEVDWANTGAMVALSDITADVTGLTWETGRDIASQLAGRATAGKAVINLRNNSDQYNRNNAAGAYFGNILPGRKVRITDTTTGQIQFSGFMVNPATMVTMPRHKTAQMTAYGIIAELARPDINIAKQSNITTGALIDAVLDQAGLTSADHDIDVGQTTVTKYFKSDRQKALGAIREFEYTESGFVRENHHLDGILAFEDRHHRLKTSGQDSQATFGDSATAGQFGFDQIQPSDDMALIFNEFVARVELFTTQPIATVWTHAEANTSGTAPSIIAGESLVVWSNYPNPSTANEGRYIDTWTTPVATTDYTTNTQTGGGGTDRTGTTSIVVAKLSNAMKITLTNGHATDTVFLTSLKARGTAVFADDPVTVREQDTTSQAAYTRGMPKTWERRAEAKWVPSTSEALDWAKSSLSIYKNPSPTVVMGYKANRDLYTSHEASVRQVSDRISLDLTGASGTGLDIDEDFYVEKVRHHVNLQGSHRVTYWLSSTAGFSDFWVLGKSLLGTETRVAY